MNLSTTKNFNVKAAEQTSFYNENGEPRVNIEGIVEIAGGSNIDISGSVGDPNSYIGKSSTATNGDFAVTYTAPTQLTLSGYPTGVSGLTTTDIESVRQINSLGDVVATYHRDDARMTLAGGVLTIAGATFAPGDTFVVSTNVPRAVSSSGGGGGAGGGSIVYTNMSGDFTATPTNGATTITITGLPFTLDATQVAAGSIKKIAVTTGIVTPLVPSAISVSGGVITLTGVDNFATGDTVAVTLIGPDKAYDTALDNQLVAVQNPQYAHTTSVETLVYEDDVTGTNLTADAGGSSTIIVDATGAFSAASTAVGFLAYDITEGGGKKMTILSVDSATQITGGTSDVTDWSSDEYVLPLVKRYEINADTYNSITLHYRLTTVANVKAYLLVYGTLDASATVDADTNWVDISTTVLGAANINGTGVATTEGIKTITSANSMLKYMVKLVVEKSTTGVSAGCLYTVFVKKGS